MARFVKVTVRKVIWVVLTVLYVLVVMPVGIARRMCGRDRLLLKFPARDATFWRVYKDDATKGGTR
ncbi:MAG: hypothetical protein N2595_11175 [bacterium]|nr:hypothetical protein [bacterium]